ncbi:hypothetical protein NIES267_01560 [Calothrix parasitica NIES-267]|uniref:Uncharacterized protein n=1 Tax=Calothrix parasitica NIES-267 TaxID=1973488 RepID=A0A1Z4LHP7_9CYAN|nr:hypothetical protein NIES267_01560 [Calothrix parasitica NIES-267]
MSQRVWLLSSSSIPLKNLSIFKIWALIILLAGTYLYLKIDGINIF